MCRRARIATVLAVVVMAACSSGGDGASGITKPVPVTPGTPVAGASPARIVVPPAGGTVKSADGQLTVHLPPGAVATSLEVSVQTISNTAPSGIGRAYRVEPSGHSFDTPVALTFAVPALASVGAVGVSYQDAAGYWVPVLAVLRNAGARVVTVNASHFSDWALVASDPTRDMAGSFTITSSVSSDAPFTVTGTAGLSFVGENSVERGYLFGGSIALQPVTYQGNACTPDAPTRAITPNLAEAFKSPAKLAWGTSALYSLGCGSRTAFLELVFDNYGISHLGCTRGDTVGVAAPVTTADAATGDYTIDCSGSQNGTMRASWQFLRCSGACVSSSPCAATAAITCTASGPVCTVLTTSPVGTSCTSAGGGAGVCDASGTCTPCVTGAPCTSTNPCATSAAIACASGAPVCTDAAFAAIGTTCTASGGAAGVCDGGGQCAACTQGASCASANPCALTATIECSSGAPVCTDRTFGAVGSPCTAASATGVCNAAGTCTACSEGAACAASGPCTATSTVSCQSGGPVCVETFLAPGAACTGGVCTGTSSACNACSAGATCTSTNLCATSSSIACGSGAPVCTDTAYAADATVCNASTNAVCLGGACSLCTPGASCVPSSPCHVGSLDCGNPNPVAPALPTAPTCVDTGVALADATGCTHDGSGAPVSGGVCVAGACVTCLAGGACTPAGTCDTGTLACGATPSCVDAGVTTCVAPQTCSAGVCM